VSDNADALARIAEVKTAIESLEGKAITVTGTREQYEQFMADRGRGLSFEDSMENIRRRFGDAIKKLGEC
jgi:hypothetical protein